MLCRRLWRRGSAGFPAQRPAPAAALLSALALAAILIATLVSPAQAATLRVRLDDGSVAALSNDNQIYLEAYPRRGEGLYAFSRRLTGSTSTASEIAEANGNPRRLIVGVRYKIPYALATGALQRQMLEALFPSDRALSYGWEHTVLRRAYEPSLWRLAEWFTGDGRNFAAIRDYNRLSDEVLHPGQSLVIPAGLLLAQLRATLPVLDYERGDDGGYGIYRLERGEALYSAVVVRFIGGTFAEDVNRLAGEIARLNDIADVTSIPVGRPIRIPFDLLLPEYLPRDHPRRLEYEKDRSASDKYSNPVRASRLEGITVILDAGHGGQDPGSSANGVWESTYVYDVTMRVKRLLETTTAAEVVTTTRDTGGYDIPAKDVLPRSRGHAVLTTPPYAIADSRVAANLRWYLANSQHRRAVARSGDDAKTVFLSIHADSLHPSHRGVMVYIPAASLTQGEYGKTDAVYKARLEVKEKPRVSFSWKERTRSEGLSRQLASHLLQSFRRQGVAIHREKPIRDRIIRCRRCRPWVPAVVRYNAVPAKLLLEICNLNNAEDLKLLKTQAFRQKVAVAVVDGILDYYGQNAGDDGGRVAAAR